ncbi:hypothetical protein [Dehalogenimonas alkenigignens]|uniref:Uncharacterized protein n=1 Tax=Dehalogenimonas alkenigignens TaxID=1217799 RepID=A0A0W0GHU0_9CHLR|nr:hypothetical protein [Dehalogenimonas alkenigignens]KTB48128.1 hypothetical protein DEALK_09730 [Dehalogenimonas alkenigignens]
MARSNSRKRTGLLLMTAGAIALLVYIFLRLSQLYADANGFSGLFYYVLSTSGVTLIITVTLIFIAAKSPDRAKPIYFLLFAIWLALSLISSMINAAGSSAQFISRMLSYALLFGGSVSTYLNSRASNNPSASES